MTNKINSLIKIDGINTTYIDTKDVSVKTENAIIEKEIPIIKYNIFNAYKDIITGFSTRLGGVSEQHLASMNLSFTRGDNPDNVKINHKLFAKALGYNSEKLVFSDQVHETNIKIVHEEDAGKGISCESDIKGIDGLVTNVPGIPLITFYADCVPLYLYDPVNKVIALAHSGWRGTVKKIGKCMVEAMTNQFGSNPADIICAIGPSICRKCYEVSQDVADEFKKVYSSDIYNRLLDDKGNGKYQLDLHKACYQNFLEAGIKADNIAMPDICTCCNSEILFSHRASHGMRGNLAAIAMIL